MRANQCSGGCGRRLPSYQIVCPKCAANGGKPADPYADVAEVIAEETDPRRIEVRPTPKAPTDS